MSLDLHSLYDSLYYEGYHSGAKNHGLVYVGNILLNHNFNSFLDIGCSQGAVVKVMQMAGKEAYGVDVSSKAIEQSKELGLDTCAVGSASKLPFEDDSFDVVFTSETLEHLPPEEAEDAVQEILRVAKWYICAKIAYEPELDRGWIEVAKEKGYEVDNLHLTVRDEEYWKNLFQFRTSWKAWYNYRGMIVYKKKGIDYE